MIYRYARVSTDGQIADAQVRQLRTAGDVLIVSRLDRLARSTDDLLNTVASIAERKAGFRSLGDAWAGTTTAHGRLMLTVLGGLAEFERELIRAHTSEGRRRAVARGVRLGRNSKLTPYQVTEALRRRDVGEPMRKIPRSYKSATARFRGLGSDTHGIRSNAEPGRSSLETWGPASKIPGISYRR